MEYHTIIHSTKSGVGPVARAAGGLVGAYVGLGVSASRVYLFDRGEGNSPAPHYLILFPEIITAIFASDYLLPFIEKIQTFILKFGLRHTLYREGLLRIAPREKRSATAIILDSSSLEPIAKTSIDFEAAT